MDSPKDLLGRPWRDLRISVTDRCNHRCVFCMPRGKKYRFLARGELLTFEEIFRIARVLVKLGVKKIRLTGGEPLLRKHLENLVALLNSLREEGLEDLALTTNGVLFPTFAEKLKQAGLDRVTISLHTLEDSLFQKITGDRRGVTPVLKAIQVAKELGFSPLKVNAVLWRGLSEAHLLALAEFCRRERVILRFIEYMDAGTVHSWSFEEVIPASSVLKLLRRRYSLIPVEPAYPGEVARRYRYEDMDLEVGLIASVTQPFCRTCNRIRLSADGKIYTCLFASQGWDVKKLLRNGPEEKLAEFLKEIWRNRKDRYSEERKEGEKRDRPEMFQLGG